MQTETFSSRLPECFRPNLHRASPPFLNFVQIWVGDKQAAGLLKQAHLLAETVADVLIDPFHIRAEGDVVPGFKAESYVYLDSRIRGEYRKRKAQLKCRVSGDTTWGPSNASDIEDDREAIEDDQEAIEPDGVLAEALHGLLSGDFANRVHTYLPHVFQAQWAPAAPSRCAMCLINTKQP